MKFQIFTAVEIHIVVFCIMILHSLVGQHQYFWKAYSFYLQCIYPKRLYPSTSTHHIIIQKTGGRTSSSSRRMLLILKQCKVSLAWLCALVIDGDYYALLDPGTSTSLVLPGKHLGCISYCSFLCYKQYITANPPFLISFLYTLECSKMYKNTHGLILGSVCFC